MMCVCVQYIVQLCARRRSLWPQKVLHSRDAHIPFGFINHLGHTVENEKYIENFTCQPKMWSEWKYGRWLVFLNSCLPFVCLFFVSFLLNWKQMQRVYKCNDDICVRLHVRVGISRRPFIKIYQMESLQWLMVILCALSHVKQRKTKTQTNKQTKPTLSKDGDFHITAVLPFCFV